LRDTNVTFLRMSDQQGEGAGALPTGEDTAGCGAEAAELSREESFGSEWSEPDQAGSTQDPAEEGAAVTAAAEAATEQRSAEKDGPPSRKVMRHFHTRHRVVMEAADDKRAKELKLNTVQSEGSKYLNPDQAERLISMAREVGKDPLDLISMLDNTIEETLRNSNGQSQREIFQAVEDSVERIRRNLDQERAGTDPHFLSNLETNSGAIPLTSRGQGGPRERVPAPRIGRTLRGSSLEIQGLARYID
jgi:hypothetical protein